MFEATAQIIRFTDGRDPAPRSRETFHFFKPEQLAEWRNQPETLRRRLRENMPELPARNLRDCQISAVTGLEKSLALNKPRARVHMTTGAGKTFTAITSVYRILKFVPPGDEGLAFAETDDYTMLARGSGNLIFVGSVSGIAGDPNSAGYSATKAGVATLARTFASRLGPRGIRVNAIAPGAVATPLTAALQTPEGDEMIRAMMAKHPSPTRRFFMQPEEIANLALFLASDSSALHGAVLVADQGLSAALPA